MYIYLSCNIDLSLSFILKETSMSENNKKTEYQLQSLKSGALFEDTYWMLDPVGESTPTHIRAIYAKKQLTVGRDSEGLYKFADWLPIIRRLKGSASPVTYKSSKLAAKLGLKNLWVTFSGYYPEIGAKIRTCSFKETEAYAVCGRMRDDEKRVLVVASAGNTARAFAQVCSDNHIPLLLSVPEDNISALYFDAPLNDCVKLVVAKTGGDYYDAIHISNVVIKDKNFFAEGGSKNVARRDGMATTVLSAVTTIGTIPDYYFQAVGSGTGAIAAWEANMRFIEDGRYGNNMMKLMVSQNAPFLPMFDAWKANSRTILPLNDDEARHQVEIIDAKVLSNRKPPYSIVGGLFDALKESNGDVLSVTNDELRSAAKLFEELEGIDINPAAAVAVASLINAVNDGTVKANSLIMLNITGGGEERYKQEREVHYLKPHKVFELDASEDFILAEVNSLFGFQK
ncbi:MAG: cysteate synthase [Mangrovibacterium sp.]